MIYPFFILDNKNKMSTQQKSMFSLILVISFFIIFIVIKFSIILNIIHTNMILSNVELLFFLMMCLSFFFYIKTSILERIEIFNRLKSREENLQLKIDAINLANGIVEFNTKGNIISINKKFSSVFGYYESELKGKNYSILLAHDNKINNDIKNLWKTILQGKEHYGEFKAIHKEGRIIYILGIYIPIKDKKGNVTKIIKIIQDNTIAKKSLLQNIQLTNNLKELESIIEESTLVFKSDIQGNIIHCNDKFCEVSGYERSELIDKNYNVISSGFYKKDFCNNFYDEILNKKKIWQGIVMNKTKSGNLYWVDMAVKATFNPITNEHTGFLSVSQDITETMKSLYEIDKKNTYLEYAAKILRHDMHSGIFIYIPRGVKGLERRLDEKTIEYLKLEMPLKLLKEGLKHTQKIYKGVYEFTNLVKKDSKLSKEEYDIKKILISFLKSTAYFDNVKIDNLPILKVNESLFCTAIDNLIRNGLKYNDSNFKIVHIYFNYEEMALIVEDNGRGMTKKEFEEYSKPYTRKPGQKELGSGLGLNICLSILKEHGFLIDCEKTIKGTRIKIITK